MPFFANGVVNGGTGYSYVCVDISTNEYDVTVVTK